MNTTNIVLIAALITAGGQWSQGKPLTIKIGIGAMFAAIGLAALSDYDATLGKDFAILILVATILLNGPALFASINKATK